MVAACACRTWSFFFFSSRRRHTRCSRDWSSDVCSSDLRRERERKIFIPRVRCRGCGVSHALLPAFVLARRLDAAESAGLVIGQVAAGAGVGRGSGRGRGEISVGAGSFKKKKKDNGDWWS